MTKMFNFKEKSEIYVTICHTVPHCNLWLFTVPLESKVRERKKDAIKWTKETKKVTIDSSETVNNHRLQPVIVYSSIGIKSNFFGFFHSFDRIFLLMQIPVKICSMKFHALCTKIFGNSAKFAQMAAGTCSWIKAREILFFPNNFSKT